MSCIWNDSTARFVGHQTAHEHLDVQDEVQELGDAGQFRAIEMKPKKQNSLRETATERQPEREWTPQRRKDLHSFECKSLIHMVRLAGIEPTTPWFVAKYSIQLSYSR